ncbi:GAF domain-containing sensor histidine kinase [Crocosphaera sp. UHCC 0190]|uniref:GAF domain-containing sensor histidine kinase n=1 Tax=Crocosphaera sp. UHCC 0190 TaxID=3110246 RepID=UPI002B1F551D|nr:GAF domain-containing sensor histidine kinase [Crocosphaera sp. UHCC 0190]MEA5508288.1 GAF domain-containing sensor histidine kinase [Crocosphaera sp. UHCC 0190]
MFSSTASVPSPSQDFITLCQSQVTLLHQTLEADWSAVYLTAEQEGQQMDLIPIVVYPPTDTIQTEETPSITLPENWPGSVPSISLPIVKFSQISQSLPPNRESKPKKWAENPYSPEAYQLVLPLIHQEMMVGLLVTRRKNKPWKPQELTQIEKITRTLAIARLLDQRQGWYQQQLTQQQIQQRQEHDRLDDLFHQIRNPITALRIFGKLLLKRFTSNDKNRAIIENMVRESEHLEELIQEFETNQAVIATKRDLITLNTDCIPSVDTQPLSLPSTGMNLKKIKLQEILEPILISAQSIAQEKGIKVQSEIVGKLHPVWGNDSALREVLSNLIDNGIKYTPKPGQVKIKLGLSRVEGEKIYQGIAIEDTGYGIPLKDQAHIFERHYRGIQAEGEIPGTGLGLAIVQELMALMGGIIELLSPTNQVRNRGTTFIIWLPLAEEC